MAKSAYQLFREKVDPKQIGNPRLRQQVMALQKQNYYQQLQQVNSNYQAGLDQGLTPGQAATSWVLPTGPNSQYTIKDGDTLPTIAAKQGTTEADILAANPDMRVPQTGMVINAPQTPAPGSEAWRTQNVGGLPSNAAQGTLTSNPQGLSPMQPQATAPGQTFAQNAASLAGPGRGGVAVPYAGSIAKTAMSIQNTPPTISGGTPQTAYAGSIARTAQAMMNQSPATAQPAQVPATQPTPGSEAWRVQMQKGNQGAFLELNPEIRLVLNTLLNQIDPTKGRNPTAGREATKAEIDQLLAHGWITPTGNVPQSGLPRPAFAQGAGTAFPQGNRNYDPWRQGPGKMPRFGGEGGGGPSRSGAIPPRYTSDNLPAFSSGGGFRGLVNWRI